jgi:NADPH-dependent curcumin reductase CurA
MSQAFTLTLAAHIANETLPAAENFSIQQSPAPALTQPGEVLLQALYFSADPYMRSAMRSDRPNSKKVGEAITGFISGKVLASNNAAWSAGDLFGGSFPLSTLQVVSAEALAKTVMWKLSGLCSEEELSLGVGLLGMPGATAWGGLLKVLRPEAGQTVLVTAASGAVGQLVGQIAKLKGCTVIGTAGGPEKCALLTSKFGFSHAIDYKALGWEGKGREARVEALVGALREKAPGGFDMVFENVGGATFEAPFKCLRSGGRIAVCGGIEGYGSAVPPTVQINVLDMIYTSQVRPLLPQSSRCQPSPPSPLSPPHNPHLQRIEGFVCSPWLFGSTSPEFLKDMSAWLREGKLVHTETVFHGLQSWPQAFASLFTGSNSGKVVVKL